ncbi:MAG: hypothetical protein NT106_12790, partial [Candidatus Sumerlaeota bacterium]|nr:hypothetical protein [Candidatus Sumerlaeota bacterium]
KPEEREHVTPYIRNHPDLFKLENYAGDENLSHYRWSVDYPEDFEFISAVYNYLYSTKPDFSMQDVLDLLRRHPEIADINRHRNARILWPRWIVEKKNGK